MCFYLTDVCSLRKIDQIVVGMMVIKQRIIWGKTQIIQIMNLIKYPIQSNVNNPDNNAWNDPLLIGQKLFGQIIQL